MILLDTPVQLQHLERCAESGTQIIYPDQSMAEVLRAADAVILNWWNHPLMSRFLASFPQAPMRLLLWSHVNGCIYPFLPANFLSRFSRVLFTTPYSLDNMWWGETERNAILKKSEIVYGSGIYNRDGPRKRDYSVQDDTFTIGYVGTLNKAKIHPETAVYCKAAKQAVPNARFLFVGEPDESLQADLSDAGLNDCVEFTGYIQNVVDQMARFNAFGYLLNPVHYGTTENAILEAMHFALPVVLLNQGTEKHLVSHESNGFLVSGPTEYAKVMMRLAKSEALRKKIGTAAREAAITLTDADGNAKRFRESVELTLDERKELISFSDITGETPTDWFIAFMPPEDKAAFLRFKQNGAPLPIECRRDIYTQETKSSLYHFRNCFVTDDSLRRLESILAPD